MKKVLSLLLALVMSLSLCACGSEPESAGDVGEAVKEENSASLGADDLITSNGEGNVMDSDGNKVNEPESPAVEYTEINFGEQISLDFVEITIDGASSGDEIKPDNPQRVYSYLPDVDDEKYVYLYGTIKNVGGDQYEFADNIYVQFTFDDKYNYAGNITADEGGDFSYIYAHLDPLKSEKFYITASIPNELAEQYEKFTVKFGFAENFDGEFSIKENECDYLYSVTVVK